MTESSSTPLSWRSTLLVGVLAVWLGGLVFYATLVVPTGKEVLGSHTAMGFITRETTNKINLLGSAILLVLLTDRLLGRRATTPRSMWIAFGVMVACQIGLFLLHPWLEGLLDLEAKTVTDPDRFYRRHQIYLWTTMLQWFAGVFYTRKLLIGA